MGDTEELLADPQPAYDGQEPPDAPPVATAAPAGGPDRSFTDIAANARWTSSDDLEFASDANSLGRLRKDLKAGVIYPHDAAPLANMLEGNLNALSQRKQAFDAHQQQTMTQAALGQNAVQRAVEQADMQHRAAGFQDTMHLFTDPTTGESTTFYQRKPGEWEPVPKKDMAGLGAADLPVGDAAPASPGEADLPVGDQPPAPRRHEMTIINGPYAEKVQYENGQIVGRSPLTFTDGRPVPAATAHESEMFGLTPDKMQHIDRMAMASSVGIPPGRSRDAHVAHVKQRLIMGAIQEDAMQKRQQGALQIQGRKEQEAMRKEDAKAHAESQKEKGKLWDGVYKDRLGELQAEWNRIREGKAAGETAEQRPAWAKDRESMEAEAEQRADRDYLRAHGHLPAAREKPAKPADQPAAEKPAAQPAGSHAGTIDALKAVEAATAEKQRRAAEAARWAPKPQPGTPEFFKLGGWGNPAFQE